MTPTDLKRLADLLFPKMSQQIDARVQALTAPGTPVADRIKMKKITEAVARVSGCEMNVMLSRQRSRPIVRLRWVAALIMREKTRASLPEMARALGCAEHTTVMHALKRGAALLESNADFRDLHAKALALLQANEEAA